MKAKITLATAGLSPEDLQTLTFDLCTTLNRETEIQANPEESKALEGAKGDLITLGTLGLTFLTSGSAVALIKVLEMYFARNQSLEVQLERPDGAKFRVKSDNLRTNQVEQTMKLAEEFLGRE